MSTMTETATQVYRAYVKATPEAVWDAITTSEWTERYGYRGATEYDLRPGGAYRVFATEDMKAYGAPDVVVEGEVIEADPPRRLVQTWHMLFDPVAEEPFTRLTWEIEGDERGFTRLTVTQEFDGSPNTAVMVSGSDPRTGGGWPFILSDLKTLLETGASIADR
jgi:uncharacterized protein YndB with AHSA1/START domain